MAIQDAFRRDTIDTGITSNWGATNIGCTPVSGEIIKYYIVDGSGAGILPWPHLHSRPQSQPK